MSQNYDLIVAGGGPGGTTLATLVAMQGYKVLLLEKETFPRHQIGESLLPSTIQGICKLLGIKEEVDAAQFVPKKGGTFIWGKSKEPWTFNFDFTAVDREPEAKAFQVERCRFDDILLKNAIKKGVDVKQSCTVLDVIKNDNRVVGVKYKDNENNIIEMLTKFVADASGYRSNLFQHVGERIASQYFDNVAIYGYFHNGKRLPPPYEGNITCVAFKQGWFWYIPLTVSKELTSVGVVIDKHAVSNLHANMEEIFNTSINECPIIREYLANAVRAEDEHYGKLRIRKDYSYSCTKLWMPGMVLIGDAACFIDPVFSSGVHLTTFAALLAARSINSILRGDLDEKTCFEFYEKKYRREYANFYNFLVSFYDMDQDNEDYFWAAKKIIKAQDRPEHAFIKLISGYSTDQIIENEEVDNNSLIKMAAFNTMVYSAMTSNEIPTNAPQKHLSIDNFMPGYPPEIISLHAKAMGIYGYPLTTELMPTEDLLHWQVTDKIYAIPQTVKPLAASEPN